MASLHRALSNMMTEEILIYSLVLPVKVILSNLLLVLSQDEIPSMFLIALDQSAAVMLNRSVLLGVIVSPDELRLFLCSQQLFEGLRI